MSENWKYNGLLIGVLTVSHFLEKIPIEHIDIRGSLDSSYKNISYLLLESVLENKLFTQKHAA